jgi:hypothetical protein
MRLQEEKTRKSMDISEIGMFSLSKKEQYYKLNVIAVVCILKTMHLK